MNLNDKNSDTKSSSTTTADGLTQMTQKYPAFEHTTPSLSPQTQATAETVKNQQSVPLNETLNENPKPKKSKKKIIISIIILFLLFVLVAIFGLSWAIAYERLEIPKYPKVQAFAANYVISLPFMPKTPKYLLGKTVFAHQKVDKHSFDISMSIDSPGMSDITGLNRFDIETKGYINYEDPKNIITSLEASLSKEFNIELKKKDNYLYFKVNKLPSFIFAFLGLDISTFDSILDNWVAYDTTPLNTNASQELQRMEDKESKSISSEFLDELNTKYFDETFMEKIKIEMTTEGDKEFYKISLDMDKDLLDHLDRKFANSKGSSLYQNTPPMKTSDIIKSMNLSLLIDKKTFYTHKISVTSEMEFDQGIYPSSMLGISNNLAQNSRLNLAVVIVLDDFGMDIPVELPLDYISFEEFSKTLSEVMMQVYRNSNIPSY